MNGIINILKPPAMTSFDVVALLRGLTGVRRIGHAGTLDPMATGVLPVCIGRATKAIEFLMDKDKLYRAELTLGITTDTQDTTGSIISQTKPNVNESDIAEAVSSFEGKYMQTPPMHSAIRVDGKRLYELARQGVEVERKQREVEIYSAKVLDIDSSDGVKVIIDIHCSKGTYIRTLCADIGDRLGCGGCMSFLLRMRAGPFDISDAFTMEMLSELKEKRVLHSALVGVDRIFASLCSYRLEDALEKRFRNGMGIPISQELLQDKRGLGQNSCNFATANSTLIRVYDSAGDFLALGTITGNKEENYLKVRKFF